MARDIIIFSGHLGRSVLGGKSWACMQYLAGLKELGFEVIYLEECGRESWIYNWDVGELVDDINYPSDYVKQALSIIGLEDSWIFRAGKQSRGMPENKFRELCSQATALIVRGTPLLDWRPEYHLPKVRAYIDVDPGFTQLRLINGDKQLLNTVERCETHFTIGQRIGERDCGVPDAGYEWQKILPPVSLAYWPLIPGEADVFTAIMDFKGFLDIHHGGNIYGQKSLEIPNYLNLPRNTRQPLLIAHLGGDESVLKQNGWISMPGGEATSAPSSYRSFIQTSRAEFGIAKHGYVTLKPGWISDRSICYLASGRPILIQDTGLESWLPMGEGIFTFSNIEQAVTGIDNINDDYLFHQASARDIAETFFSTEKALRSLLHSLA